MGSKVLAHVEHGNGMQNESSETSRRYKDA